MFCMYKSAQRLANIGVMATTKYQRTSLGAETEWTFFKKMYQTKTFIRDTLPKIIGNIPKTQYCDNHEQRSMSYD